MIKKEINAKIDTIQLITIKDNVNMEELERLRGYDNNDRCISKVRALKDEKITVVIHPSRLYSRYSDYSSYKEYKERISIILDIIFYDISLLKLRRLDICIDYMSSFKEQLKLNKALMECVEREKKISKKYFKITDEKDNRISSYKWSNDRSFTLSIYDKNKESRGNHTYNTRVEYRLIYSNKNYYIDVEKQCIEDLLILIDRFNREEHYNKAIDKQVELLSNEALKTKNFTTFLLSNDDVIFDIEIAKKIYELKGKTKLQATKLISRVKKENNTKYIKHTEYKRYLDTQRVKIKEFKDC